MSKDREPKPGYSTSRDPETGEWQKYKGHEVGRVDRDGNIEGTPYSFKRRGVVGGVAFTQNSKLEKVVKKDGTVAYYNPSTKEWFNPTKKGTGYWGKESNTFFNPMKDD